MRAPTASTAFGTICAALLCLAVLAAGFARASAPGPEMRIAAVEIGGVAVPICSTGGTEDSGRHDPATLPGCCQFCLQELQATAPGPAAIGVAAPPLPGAPLPQAGIELRAEMPRRLAGTIRGPPGVLANP